MGLKGGLVRRVFSKSRSSTGVHDCNEKNFGAEKSRWNSVRFYFCGDEFNSPMEDDLGSVKGSEVTVMQPMAEGSGEESSSVNNVGELGELIINQEEDPPIKSFSQENAAIYIQSAFRGFLVFLQTSSYSLAFVITWFLLSLQESMISYSHFSLFQVRQQYDQIKQSAKGDHTGGLENPSGASEVASTEVQIGDSIENLKDREESITIQHRVLHKARSQVYRLKEEWDDSTVSSNISKLRIQNRLEATTRRERALAYAFSQQLRICTSKKKSAWSGSTESNVGWSWLERWMATRMPENSMVEDCLSKHLEPISTEQRSMIIRKRFDVAVEEKESCGSNDVSVNLDRFSTPSQTPRDGYGPVKNRLKAARSVSRRKTLPDYHCKMRSKKVSKRDLSREAEDEKRFKQDHPKSTGEIECKDTFEPPSDY